MRSYQICSKCVMDTSDPDISFDDEGVCIHCSDRDTLVNQRIRSGEEGRAYLATLAETIRREGRGKQYDCLIGLSGGVDSTYVAYEVKRLGLRPLALHFDNGWDSPLAVQNIENAVKRLGIDLETYVVDWGEFRDLQLAFLKASTPDGEVPTDHAIVSLMYRKAREIGTKYILSGCNVRTETHLPESWSRGHGDWKYIRSVHRQFGAQRLKTFPHRSLLGDRQYRMTLCWVDILDSLDYVKRDAKELLVRELGWTDYGGKHHESLYTRFFQGYILPRKFGFDKRRSHLSSLVCSGEIMRSEALSALEEPPYEPGLQETDREYVAKKLGLSDADFAEIMNAPARTFWDYPSYAKSARGKIQRVLRAGYRAARGIIRG